MALELRGRARARRRRGGVASCSPTTASGATWSRSPGTSRPSRGRTGVEDMLDAHARARAAARLRTRPSRRPRPTASPRPGSSSRPRPAAATATCGCGRQGVDAADRAARAQGPRGAARRRARPHGRRARRRPRPRDLARGAPAARPRSSATTTPALRRDRRRRPGRDRARRAAAPARRADDHRRAQRAPRRLLAQALQVALPARPGLVRPPAVHQVPRELAGVLAEGQDRRLARDVHAGDGAQLLGLHRRPRARRYDEDDGRVGRRSSSATAPTITLRPEAARARAPGMSGKPNVPEIEGMDVFKGDQHHSSQHPGPDAYARQAGAS